MNLSQIEDFFNKNGIPNGPIRLNVCEVWNEPKKLVSSHIVILKANSGNKAYMPYYNRLIKIVEYVKAHA